MSYFDGVASIGATIILGVVAAAIWSAMCGLARLTDRAVPDLARRTARWATRMIPAASRDLYNFESDVHEALQDRHRYSAFGTALRSLVRVAPRVALRERGSLDMLRAVTAVTAATANVVFAVAGLTADDEAGSMANVVNPVANVVFAVLFFFAVVFLFFGGAFFARVIRRRSRPETSSE